MGTRRGKDDAIEIKLAGASVLKIGTRAYDYRDPYHFAVALDGARFFAVVVGTYLAINVLFALAYVASPGCIANARSLLDVFFFSIETLATVGYGDMAPATTYGHIVASIETVVGIAFTAVATGIIFVRFSRPKSNVVFADSAVVTTHDGKPTLMLRLGYARTGMLVGARAHVDLILVTQTREGRPFRRMHELSLVRARVPMLVLTWSLMHVIDEASPLYGLDEDALRAAQARVVVTLEAKDDAAGVDVFDLKTYGIDHIVFGSHFADVVLFDARGNSHADMRRLSDLEPDAGA